MKKGNKDVFVDSVIVFVSCYICEFLSKRIGFKGVEFSDVGKPPVVFTDNAGF